MKDSGCSDGSLFLSCFPKPLEASGDARYDALWRTELSCTDAGGAAQTYYCGASYKAEGGTSYADWRGAAVLAIISWRAPACSRRRVAGATTAPSAQRPHTPVPIQPPPPRNPQVVLQNARPQPGGAAARGTGVGGGGACAHRTRESVQRRPPAANALPH